MSSGPDALMKRLLQCERVLLTGPVGPDGDSIAACLALQAVLQRKGIPTTVAGEPGFRYAWLPGATKMLADALIGPDYDGVVVLDGDRHRLTPEVTRAFEAARVKAIVDHHASTLDDGYDVAWLDSEASSTCEMLFRALPAWNSELTQKLAILIYTGCVFDTAAFRYSNTAPHTHRMAARLLECGIDHADICARVLLERRPEGLLAAGLIYGSVDYYLGGRLAVGCCSEEMRKRHGIGLSDLEGIVDGLVFTSGVEVAVLLIERGDKVKYSLRSRGRIDVAALAASLTPTGGGHRKAAGATVQRDLEAAKALIINAVSREREVVPLPDQDEIPTLRLGRD